MSPKGLSEVLVHGAYNFTKTNLAKFAIQHFTGNGLGFLDSEEHRVCIIICYCTNGFAGHLIIIVSSSCKRKTLSQPLPPLISGC